MDSAPPMTRFLTLRSRALSRTVAATFVAMYALFASGAAFGALDLACLKLEAPACTPTAGPAAEKDSCGCGHAADDGAGCCCCSQDEAPAPATGFSFTAAARCANPDSGSHDGMTRVSPHVTAHARIGPGIDLVRVFIPEELTLLSIDSAPPEKVPLALT
jgi:hypothetical protein